MSVIWCKQKTIEILPFINLEYIETNGTQHIDTEFIPDQNTRVVMDALLIEKTGTAMYFGAKADDTYTKEFMLMSLNATDGTVRSDYFGTRVSASMKTIGVNVHIDKNKNKCKINDLIIENTATIGTAIYPLFLFASNYYGTVRYQMTGRLYSCKIYDNDVLVRDYIPVKMKSSKRIGLWDKVTNKFYGNAGTGRLIAGNIA